MEEFCASEKEFPEVIKETIFRCVPVQKTVHYTTPPKEYTDVIFCERKEWIGIEEGVQHEKKKR